MKRLIRFVLLTLGYLVASLKVAGRVIVRSLRKSKFGPKKTAVFGVVAAILAVVLSLTVATPARAYVEGTRNLTTVSLGGQGGGLNANPVSCPTSTVIKGFRMNSSTDTQTYYATQLVLECNTPNPDLNGNSGTNSDVIAFGSDPGASYETVCPSGSVAYGVAVKSNKGSNGYLYINDIAPLCKNIINNTTATTPATKPTTQTPNQSASCPAGTFLVGIRMYTGGAIDGIAGLNCASYTYVQNSPSNVTITHTNGNTVTVSFTDNSWVDNGYRVEVLDAAGTTQLAYTDLSPVSGNPTSASATFSTATYPSLRCGLAFTARVTALNASADTTVLNSAQITATSTAYSSCTTSSISVSSSATSNLWWDSTTNSYKAISAGSAGTLNVDDLRTKLQTGASGTNTTIASGGALTFSAALTTSGTACGTLTVGSPDNSVTLNSAINLSSCTSGTPLVVKSATDIFANANITTNAGAVTFWSDTDAASSRGGGIKVTSTSTITTNGGAVNLSGGTDNTTSWAKGTTNTGETGVWLAGTITTGAGNITIRGEEAASPSTTRQGVLFDFGSSTTTTSGTITVNGRVDSTSTDSANNHYGVWIGNNNASSLAYITTGSGDINILGDSTNNTSGVNRRGIIMFKATVSSTSGAITLDGRANTNSGCNDLWFYTGNNTVSSTSGAVTIKGSSGATTTFENATISSGASVTLQVSKPAVATSNTLTLGGAGDKVIEYPAAATDFAAAVTTTGFSFGTTSKSIRIGTASVTQSLTVTSAIAAAGPISLLANSVQFSKTAGLDTTALAGSAILVKTKKWIQSDSQDSAAAATKFVTDNGDITFWTVSGGGTDGSVTLGNYTVLDSTNGDKAAQATGGGRITIAGGTATTNGYPTGPTMGGTNNTSGIHIYNYVRLYSGGGDQYLYGKSPSGNYFGFRSGGDFIADSGQGQITVRGDNTAYEWANTIGDDNAGDTVFLSEKTSGTAIDISGNSSYYAALSFNRNGTTAITYVVANGGGAINLTGNGSTSYVGLALDRTQVLSTSGKITLDGGPSWLGVGYMSRGEVYLGAKSGSSYVTSSTADVLLKATTYLDTDNTTTTAINTGGNVVAESAGTSFTAASSWAIPTTSGSFRYGKTTDVQDITFSAAVTSAVSGSNTGAISANAKAINVNAAMSGTSVTIKPTAAYTGSGAITASNGAVSITGGTSVAPTGAINAAGKISLSGSGAISTATSATLTSSTDAVDISSTGGAVTLDKAVSASTYIGVALTGAYSGAGSLTAGTTVSITGGTGIAPTANIQAGGNITMSGSGQGYFNGVRVNSTGGSISLTSGPYAGHAVQIQNSIFSATTSPITISGTGTSGEGVYMLSGSAVSTTTGNITVNGVGSDWGVYLATADIISTSGAIKIDGGTRGIVDGYGATTNFGAIPTGTSQSSITILGDRNWNGSTQVNFKTTGAVTLDSKAADYIEAPNYLNHKFDGCSSVSIGHLSAAYQVTVQATATISGPFSVLGQYVVVNASSSLKTTMAKSTGATKNIGILLKATDKIYILSAAGFETSGADIVFWSDADNNGVGSMYFTDTNVLKSAGGDIVLGGGLDDGGVAFPEITGHTANDGEPDGYAAGVNGFGVSAGIDLISGYQLLSGGGNISIAGRGSADIADSDMGVVLRGGLIYSAAGTISIFGRSPAGCTNNYHQGIFTGYGAQTNIISDNTTANAIYLYGNTASCDSTTSVQANAIAGWTSYTEVAATNGGDVRIYGIQGSASWVGTWYNTYEESNIVSLNYWDVMAKNGNINITAAKATTNVRWGIRFAMKGNVNSYVGGHTADIATGYTGYPTIAAFTNSGDITLTADSVCPYYTWLRTTGNLTIQPNASNTFDYKESLTASAWATYFPTTYKNVRIGKAGTSGANQSAADIDIDKISATGDIAMYGGTIDLKGGVTTSESSGNGILIKATQDVIVDDGASATRTPVTITGAASTAPIYLWSNADASGSGAVKIGNYTDITSQGGPIYLGGSTAATDTAPTTYALNNSSTYSSGVALGTSTTANGNVAITSNGGDVTIRGKTTYDGGGSMGILAWGGLNINSGVGAIVIDAYTNAPTGSSNGHGIEFNWASGLTTSISSAKTSGTAISISGVVGSGATSTNARGIVNWSGASVLNVSASGGGDISMVGTASPSTTQAISLNGANILANGGNITLNAGTKGIDFGQNANAQTNSIGGSASNAKANVVRLRGDNIVLPTYATAFQNANSVYLVNNSTSFNAAQTFGSGMSTSNIGYLGIGLSTNTAAVTVSGTNSVGGNIDVYGGAVTVSGNQSTTAGGNITIAGTGAYSGAGTLNANGNVSVTGSSFSGTGAITSAGSGGIGITATSGDAAIAANLAANTSASAPIVVRASANIPVTASKTLTTAGGGVVLWARYLATEGSTTVGSISMGNSSSISTSGGRIVLAGTTQVDGNGIPTGHAYTATTSTSGVGLGTSALNTDANVSLNSGNGPISIYGQAATGTGAGWGILTYGGVTINAGTSTITMDGKSDSQTGTGVELDPGTATQQTKVLSAATSGTAISITGTETGTVAANAGERGIGSYSVAGGLVINASGGGDIVLTGTSAVVNSSNPGAIYIGAADILASTGNITLNGGAKGVVTSASGLTSNIGATSAGSATGSVTIIGDNVTSLGTTNLKTTGAVVVESTSANFTAVSLSGFAVNAVATSIRVGKTTDTSSAMSIGGSLAANGPISIYGGNITLSAGLTVDPSTTGAILVKGGGNVATSGTRAFSTKGGNITFWADSDVNSIGRVYLDNSNTVTSNGGAVTLAGGADNGTSTVTSGRSSSDGLPDGYAWGNGGSDCNGTYGVQTGTDVSISTAGGTLFIAGRGQNLSTYNCSDGVYMNGGNKLSAGAGKIGIFGVSNAQSTGEWSRGITFNGASATQKTIISSSNTAADSIVISGDSTAAASTNSSGILFARGTGNTVNTIVANTSTGGIQITGRSGSAVAAGITDYVGDGIEQYGLAVLGKGGQISLTGTTSASASSIVYGLSFDHTSLTTYAGADNYFGGMAVSVDSVDMTNSSSNVVLNVDSISNTTTVNSVAYTRAFKTTGTVTIQPADSAQSFDRTVDFSGLTYTSGVTGLTIGQSGTSGVVSGTTQTANDLTIPAVSIAGPISLYGQSISLTGGLASSTASKILVKARGNITLSASKAISTTNGPIVIWGRAGSLESSTDAGYFTMDNGASVTSGGGPIYIAGSTSVDSNSYPNGHLYTNESSKFAVGMGTSPTGTNMSVNSSGGDIRIYGQTGSAASQAMAVQGTTASTINAVAGRVDINLVSATTNDNVFEAWNGGLTVSSSAPADGVNNTPAVKWVSNQTNSAATFNPIQTGGVFSINATGGGDIDFTATSAKTTVYSLDITKNFQLLASTGQIRANFGANGLDLTGAVANGFILGAISGGTSSSNIALTGDRFNEATANSTAAAMVARTSGTVTIAPSSTSFAAAQTFDSTWSFPGVTGVNGGYIGGLTVGAIGNTAGISSSVSATVAGDVTVIGGATSLTGAGLTTTNNGNITVTSSGAVSGSAPLSAAGNVSITGTAFTGTGALTSAGTGGIVVTATAGDVNTGASMTANTSTTAPIVLSATTNVILNYNLTTNGGRVTLGADSDDLNGGGILTDSASQIISKGGAVTLGGGVDPTVGYAKARALITSVNNAGYSGVRLMGRISADAGDVNVRGIENSTLGNGNYNAGIEFEKSALISTTTGNITLDGKTSNGQTGTGTRFGVIISWAGTEVVGTTNKIQTTSGNINIKGDASTLNNANSYGVGTYSTAASTTTGAITYEGIGATLSPDDIYWSGTDVSSTSGAVTVKTGTVSGVTKFDGATAKITTNGAIKLQLNKPSFTLLNLAGSGAKTIEPVSGTSYFAAALDTTNVTISSTSSSLTLGSSTNTAAITSGKATSIAGPITISGGDVTVSAALTATTSTGSIAINSNGTFTGSAAISSAAGNQPTTIKADKAAITGSIASGTAVTQITGFTAGKTIDMGLVGDTTATLALSNTELGNITAGTIRIGDSTSGNITVSAAISIASAKSNNLALRTAGNITATGGATISATNLGLSAGGTISLPGTNGVSGNLALVAVGASAGSGASFGASGTYSVDSVDSIDPVYGLGKNISISSAPAIGSTEVRYLNQTWSAPPVVTVKDAYGYVISANNSRKSTYTTTVTGSGAPTIAGATPVIAGGTQTFSSLKFTTATGSTALTFTTANLVSGGTSSVTTGTYDVQAGEPASIAIATTATTAQAGKIGFGLTATLKDAGSNTVAGPHATDAITVSVSDGDSDATNNATIVSGGSPSTTAGVADFSNLILGGKVGVNYTLTFTVTYLDSSSVSQTKTATQVVTLTPGDATKVGITTQAAGFVNRTNFTTQPVVAIQDAYGNTVTSSTATVAAAVTAVGTASTQGLSGATTKAAVSGVATFSDLGKTGLVGTKRLTFSSTGLSSDSQDFTLTFGAANQLAFTTPATTVNDTVFATQPTITIQDQDGNTVTDSTATVTLSSSTATIGGTVAMDATAGVANFSGKGVKLTGGTGTKSMTATIAGGIVKTNNITITYGAAYKLAITQQAAGAVNGVAFTTQPKVTVQDISGNTVDNATDPIGVASSGATLSGTTPVNASAGTATFSGLKLTGTAATYTLTFTSGSLASDQQSITVTYGAAHHLSITNSAAGAVNGVAFTTQPVITIQDQSNNTVANSTASVAVSVGSGTTISGTSLNVNAVAGVATFAGLKLTGTAATYTLTYASTGITSATQQITVTPGAATQLVLTTSAAGFVNRANFTTAPAVSIEDASGNVVTTATDNVTVSIDTGDLTGSTTVAAINGVATFTGLGKYGQVGNKTLTFRSGSLTAATQQFALTFGAAYQLAKTTSAAGFTNDVAFTTQPKITIQDQDGNTVADSTATVTVTSSGATLGGTTSMPAVAGVADFAGKGIKLTGTIGGYTLTYASTGLTSATQSITLTFGAAHHLSLTTSAAGAVDRVAFTTQPVLEVRDISNNVVTNSTLTVTAASSAGATIGGTATRAASAGVADFGLNTTKTQLYGTVGSYTITYSATGVTAATQSLALTFGAPSQLVMTSPSTTVNDTVFGTPAGSHHPRPGWQHRHRFDLDRDPIFEQRNHRRNRLDAGCLGCCRLHRQGCQANRNRWFKEPDRDRDRWSYRHQPGHNYLRFGLPIGANSPGCRRSQWRCIHHTATGNRSGHFG